MPIRLSGMISGMDTDALVKELVSAYSIKKDNYVKEQTKLEWQMDAWKTLNTKVYSFYTNKLSPMRFTTAYSKKTASVSDTAKATVKADGNAVNGTQTLEINKLATTGYLTGAQLKKDEKVTASTKLSAINNGNSSGILNINVDGKASSIELNENMNVGQLVGKLKEAGLNASFDETNQRFFISAKTSGEQHDFSLTGDANAAEMMKSLGIYAVSTADISQYQKTAAYTDSDLENMALNDYLKNQISAANKTYSERNTKLAEENSALSKEYSYANMTSENKAKAYVGMKEKMKKLEDEIQKLYDEGADYTAIEAKEKQLEQYQATLNTYDEVNEKYGIKITGDTVEEAGFEEETTDNTLSEEDRKNYVQGLVDQVNANKAEMTENSKAVEANNKLASKKLSSDEIKAVEFTKYGEADTSTIRADYENDDVYKSYLAKYEGIRTEAEKVVDAAETAGVIGADGKITDDESKLKAFAASLGASDGVRITGADSEIVLNGATFTSNSNNYSVNGLTITANAVTKPGEKVSITTETDVDGIYNMIKDTLKEYNALIKEMDTLFNAASSKGYEPLTDEEKDALSDTEVEKWEKKIKDSLLRRDSTLSGVISTMKMAMSTSYNIGGKAYSLSSFGISTLGYFASGENEKGVYHIDGDSDDGSTSGKKDKLRAAIANDPDTVVSFFQQLSQGLYDKLTKKMASSSVSSAYTIYNDKQMKKTYERYDDTIEKWEEKLTNIENKYYKQFAAMETALAKLQSSTSALSSLMGS